MNLITFLNHYHNNQIKILKLIFNFLNYFKLKIPYLNYQFNQYLRLMFLITT